MPSLFDIRRDIFISLIIVSALVIYWQVGDHEFISFDDGLYIFENPKVQAGISLDSLTWAFGFTDIAYWHPLTWLSHMLDCQLFGLNPGRHHMVNVIFHLANSLLLFYVFRRMTGDSLKSGVIALLFAVHPINVESVAWVAARKNVLNAFLGMLSLLSYSYYAVKPRLRTYLPTILFFALGLMAKPAIITLPFVLLLLDYWPLKRFNCAALMGENGRVTRAAVKQWFETTPVSRIILEKIPFFCLAGASVYLSYLSTQHHSIVISAHAVPLHLRLANGLVSYMVYLGKMFWPRNLAVFYPYPSEMSTWLTVAAGIWSISTSVAVVRWSLRLPFLFVGWFWYFGTLVPHIGLMQAGLWPALADRWAYIPFIGLFMTIVWGIPEFISERRLSKFALPLVTVVTIFILAVVTWNQIGYWKNNILLYRHAIDVTRNNDVAHNNLGAAYFESGKVDRAIYHFVEALKILPGHAAAHRNLSKAVGADGNKKGAIERMQKLQRIYPKLPALHYSLGNLYRDSGQFDKAIAQYQEALEYKTDFIQAINNLAGICIMKTDYSEAIRLLKQIVVIQPYDPDIYIDIARVYAKQRQTKESIVWLKMAIEKGFSNWELLQTDRHLNALKGSTDYQDFLKNL